MLVSDLIRYPLKSCKGAHHNQLPVDARGFVYDRQWALFDTDGQVITGRQKPKLLDIEVNINDKTVEISVKNSMKFSWSIDEGQGLQEAKIFSNDVKGKHVNQEADQWFSEYLGQKCIMLKTDHTVHRPVLSKHGGKSGDEVHFSDQAPILLVSEGSLEDLNSRLEKPITMERFRPNIVLNGPAPYEEDTWQKIKIGPCIFEVLQCCERCIFTTIDPTTKKKDPTKEPLRTLATYRKVESGGVIFGVHLIARQTGIITLGDEVSILE